MPDARARAALAEIADLESRDDTLAEQLATVDSLTGRTAAVRREAVEVSAALDRLPQELVAAETATTAAQAAARSADDELAEAVRRAESLGRRAGQDERDQVQRELTRARQEVHDAGIRVEHARGRLAELDELRRTLAVRSEGIGIEARAVAAAIRGVSRVADAGKGDPGDTLAAIDDWGARARAALFVARGTLANERERVVLEANALGSAILGEELGGSSVGVVRRRVAAALADDSDT